MMASPLIAIALLLGGCYFDSAGVTGTDGGPVDAVAIDADPCTAAEIEAEAAHTCARRADGVVTCWGNNGNREVGATDQTTCPGTGLGCNPMPAPVATLPAMVDLALGDVHTCGRAEDGSVFCWGSNADGQFGDTPAGAQWAPIEIVSRDGALELVGGEAYTCGRASDGAITCSGRNAHGELGIGSTEPSSSPIEVPDLDALALAGGYQMVCASRDPDGQVSCWGNDDLSPRLIEGVTGATDLAAGLRHACAIVGDRSGLCWGSNDQGQLGAEPAGDGATVTIPVPPPLDAIAASVNHTCVLRTGAVLCWGEGYGPSPALVPLPRLATAITAGSYHDCAIVDDGSVWCWGWNAYGQLGDGTFDDHAQPVEARLCP